jgi:hypothetical protein
MAGCAALGAELHYEDITVNPTTAKNASLALDIVGIHMEETALELSRHRDRIAYPQSYSFVGEAVQRQVLHESAYGALAGDCYTAVAENERVLDLSHTPANLSASNATTPRYTHILSNAVHVALDPVELPLARESHHGWQRGRKQRVQKCL